MRKFGFSFALAAACLAANPALAADATFAWKDLDLNTDAGQAELGHRIDAAALQVCAPGAITGSRIMRGPSARCVTEARTAITAHVAAKTGKARLAANGDTARSGAR